jgi:hypothetical protein
LESARTLSRFDAFSSREPVRTLENALPARINLAHFFVTDRPCHEIRVRRADAFPAGSGLPPKTPLCPFSAQAQGKLMQKIHRLTDN